MSTKNRGYVSDRPSKGEKQKKTKLKDTFHKAGKKGGSDKRKRIGE